MFINSSISDCIIMSGSSVMYESENSPVNLDHVKKISLGAYIVRIASSNVTVHQVFFYFIDGTNTIWSYQDQSQRDSDFNSSTNGYNSPIYNKFIESVENYQNDLLKNKTIDKLFKNGVLQAVNSDYTFVSNTGTVTQNYTTNDTLFILLK